MVDNTYLDFDKPPYTSAHPVFGIVVSNFSVVQAIGKVPTNASDRPLTDVVMDSLRVTFDPFAGTGFNGTFNNSIYIYPNPVNEESVIFIRMKSGKDVNILVYDQLGRILVKDQKRLMQGTNSVRANDIINFNLVSGIYHLVITGEGSAPQQLLIMVPWKVCPD